MNRRIINPSDPSNGGVQIQRVPIIPWKLYVQCGLKVAVDGKVVPAMFTPQPMESVDELFQVLRLLLAAHDDKPGPIAWQTVPPEVQRHFSFQPPAPPLSVDSATPTQ